MFSMLTEYSGIACVKQYTYTAEKLVLVVCILYSRHQAIFYHYSIRASDTFLLIFKMRNIIVMDYKIIDQMI